MHEIKWSIIGVGPIISLLFLFLFALPLPAFNAIVFLFCTATFYSNFVGGSGLQAEYGGVAGLGLAVGHGLLSTGVGGGLKLGNSLRVLYWNTIILYYLRSALHGKFEDSK